MLNQIVGCSNPDDESGRISPVIPRGYDRIAQWQMHRYGGVHMCYVLLILSYIHKYYV